MLQKEELISVLRLIRRQCGVKCLIKGANLGLIVRVLISVGERRIMTVSKMVNKKTVVRGQGVG